MNFDGVKFEALIRYVIDTVEPAKLGLVKLHKILYFCDMMHYADHGAPLTGATYRKLQFGPVCDELDTTLEFLENSEKVRVSKVDYFGYQKTQFELLEIAPTDFTNHEKALIDEVVEFVCERNSAKTISDFSHNAAWEVVDSGEVIPYSNVYLMFPSEVSPEAIAWSASEAVKIEVEKQKSGSVGSQTLDDFRGKILQPSGR